jgi:adenosylcobinamide amidohydrolase
MNNWPHETLLMDFHHHTKVLTTLTGSLPSITTVANHYLPPPCWPLLGEMTLDEYCRSVCRTMDRNSKRTAMMVTGVRIAHLAHARCDQDNLTAWALVTAGVKRNGMRQSEDEGLYVEPGTINTIVMTNRRLTDRAMIRAVVTATESKTAALQDLDVRSCFHPVRWQATGTGTDNLTIVQGWGSDLDLTGGHTRMGELIAKSVYLATIQAIDRQNDLCAPRHILQRLEERGLGLLEILEIAGINADADEKAWSRLEYLVDTERYAGFLETALALEDAYQRNLLADLEDWRIHCGHVASEIHFFYNESSGIPADFPVLESPLTMAFEALLIGIGAKGNNP